MEIEDIDFDYQEKFEDLTITTKKYQNANKDEENQDKDDKIIASLTSQKPDEFNDTDFISTLNASDPFKFSLEKAKDYGDPLLNLFKLKNILVIGTIIYNNPEFYLRTGAKYVIQQEVLFNEKVQIVDGDSFIIGRTLFDVKMVSLQKQNQLAVSFLYLSEQKDKKQNQMEYLASFEGTNEFSIGRNNIPHLKIDKFISRIDHAKIIKQNDKLFLSKTKENSAEVWFCISPKNKNFSLKSPSSLRIGLSYHRLFKTEENL